MARKARKKAVKKKTNKLIKVNLERKKEEEDVFYVGIKNPVELRKNILEASKDVVDLMQKYEKIKELREEKANLLNELAFKVKDARKLLTNIKAAMPKTSLRIKIRERLKEEKPEKEIEEVKPETKTKSMEELKKLEEELTKIEERLRKI